MDLTHKDQDTIPTNVSRNPHQEPLHHLPLFSRAWVGLEGEGEKKT
jgi:hypothetical protein